MIHPLDDRLRREARRYDLRFTCDACCAFDPERRDCAYGFPTRAHRDVDLDRADRVVFCKAFEMA